MSREKQIEEMEAVIESIESNASTLDWGADARADAEKIAETLYNAGYRKQSEGEWIVEEHPLLHDKKISCSCCGYSERKGPVWNISWGLHSFCPNCGAQMKGGAEE